MSIQSNYPRQNLSVPNGETCPQCGEAAGKRVRYTWWGGAIGPALMSLTRCQACGYQFNSNTGKSTKRAILIYNVVAAVTCIVFVIVTYFARN